MDLVENQSLVRNYLITYSYEFVSLLLKKLIF